MTNKELISEYIKGERRYGAANHLGYDNEVLINYATEICRIDRKNKTATVNSRRYSRTTSGIQSELRYRLSAAGYTITEYEGEPATMWNCGYQGAPNVTVNDMKER